MIYHLQGFAHDKLYGKALNQHIELLPDDCWICIRDLDTMILTPTAPLLMQKAIDDHPDTELFTCATNRTYGGLMLGNPDVTVACRKAFELQEKEPKYSPMQGVVPAFFWLFPKRVWIGNRFDEHPIIHNRKSFDVRWSRKITGKKLRIDNLYVFHLYRLYKNSRSHTHLL